MSDGATGRNNRRFLGLFPSARAQLKYAFYNAAFVAFFVFCTHLVVVLKIEAMAEQDPRLFLENLVLVNLMHFMRESSYWIGLAALVYTGVSTVLILHRFSGPSVAVRQYIDELIQGNCNRKLTFRKGDELSEIAEKLNELQETLAKR